LNKIPTWVAYDTLPNETFADGLGVGTVMEAMDEATWWHTYVMMHSWWRE
jgi:hypothetical protein